MAYRIGHIPGAVNIRDDRLDDMLADGVPFPPGLQVVFVCPIGEYSRRVAAFLSQQGHRAASLTGAGWWPGGTPGGSWSREPDRACRNPDGGSDLLVIGLDHRQENAVTNTQDVRPFQIDIPQAQLDDLRERLDRTRWTEELADGGWDYGVPVARQKELLDYWRSVL